MSNIQRYQQPGLVATNVQELEALGKMCAASGFFQDARQAAQAMVKIAAGQELGLAPIQSMTGIHVIKNRVTLSANLMAALLKKAGYRWKMVQFDDMVCSLVMIDPHGTEVGPSSFSMADAKKAGIANGENWQKYPRNMLFARAISNAARWYAPEVITGCYTPEEMGSGIVDDAGYTEIIPTQAPECVEAEETEEPEPVETDVVDVEPKAYNNAMAKPHAVGAKINLTHEQIRSIAGVESLKDLSATELRQLADEIGTWLADDADLALAFVESQNIEELSRLWMQLPPDQKRVLARVKDAMKRRLLEAA